MAAEDDVTLHCYGHFRDSKTAPYHWKNDLPFSRIQEIQDDCAEALDLWGYHSYKTQEELETVHPVGNYSMDRVV